MDRQYEALTRLRSLMETMKKNQELRGGEALVKRMNTRAATHKTWRQMKGMQLAMHEMNHAGNKPFVIGLGITVGFMMYAYSAGLKSEEAKKDSKYWQRFHAAH